VPRRADAASPSRASSRLSREGIVAAAVELADREGLAALSMRRLAQHLGVDAMSIYYHLRDKDTLLAAMADAVTAEIATTDNPPAGSAAAGGTGGGGTGAVPVGAGSVGAGSVGAGSAGAEPWTEQLRALIMRARRTMLRHPWAVRVLEGRDEATPAVLQHIDRVLGVLRSGGCSVDLSHHALHLLGSRILGFSQDLFDDSPNPAVTPEMLAAQASAWAESLPHVAELAVAVTHGGALSGCDDDGEFAFALDLLLDGLERRRAAEAT
jgi:AcrR family transcriptional regulator